MTVGETVPPSLDEELRQEIRSSLRRLLGAVGDDDIARSHRALGVSFRGPAGELAGGRVHLVLKGMAKPRSSAVWLDLRVESPSGRTSASVGFPFYGAQAAVLADLWVESEEPAVILDAIRECAALIRAREEG